MKVVIAATAALTLMLAAACGDDDASPTPSQSGAPTATGAPTTPAGSPRTPQPTLIETICKDNPDPATDEELRLTFPPIGAILVSPDDIVGSGGAAPASYQARLVAEDGARIAETAPVEVDGPAPAQLQIPLAFGIETPASACLWVFKLAEDGSPENVVQVPVRLELSNDPGACQPNPEPASPDFVEIHSPLRGDSAGSPLSVSGEIVAFTGTFLVTLYDAEGNEIAGTEVPTNAGEPAEKVPFTVELPFEVTEETAACLWVWEARADDGQPINVEQAPLTLLP